MLSTELLAINPDSYIFKQTEEKVRKELNVAFEIFIARQYSCIHYSDLMDDMPDELASKDRLIKWLNDAKCKGKISRKGVITLYREKILNILRMVYGRQAHFAILYCS